MHNKFCIIDGKILINGSYNWTYYAEQRNKENIMVVHDKELIRQYLLEFDELTKGLELVTNVAEVANTDSQQDTIIENIKFASDTDIIIKAHKEFDSKNLKLVASIGEVVKGDKFFLFLEKGQDLPCKRINSVYTVNDNQTSIGTSFRYGEHQEGSKNNIIGYSNISGIPPMKAGEARCITTYELDVSGILTIIKEIAQTGKIVIHKFNIEYLITDQ